MDKKVKALIIVISLAINIAVTMTIARQADAKGYRRGVDHMAAAVIYGQVTAELKALSDKVIKERESKKQGVQSNE